MRFFLSFIVLLAFHSLKGQAFIKGKVSDVETGEPLVGVNIILGTGGVSTNIQGEYSLEIPLGTNTIVYRFIGYESKSIQIQADKDQIIIQNLQLLAKTHDLDVVVVSAGRFQQKIEDLTVSMEILKPGLIESKNTTSIETALEQTPGLVIMDNEPQIRGGSGFNFGVGSRVAVLMDDLPLLTGDAGRPEWSFIPVENIEQIEVIKGASSVMYGSSALSGVINIRTAYPKDKPLTKVNLFSGAYSEPDFAPAKWWDKTPLYYGMNFFHSRKIGQLDFVFGGNVLYDHGYIGPPPFDSTGNYSTENISNDDVATKKARMNFNLRYRSKKTAGLSYGINGNFMKSASNFSLVWLDADTGIFRAFPGTMTLQSITAAYIDPFIDYLSKDGVHHKIKSRIYYFDSDNGNNQSSSSSVYYGEYQFQKKYDFIKDLNVAAGVMGRLSKSQSEIYIGGDSSGVNNSRNAALYSQLDKKFFDVVNLSMGLRFEYFDINGSEDVVKPIFRAGLSFKTGRATFFRYSYGQGFRFPTIAEKFIQTSTGGLGVFPNPNLQPETSWNTEFGVKQGFKVSKFMGFLDAALFWQEYQNTMEYNMGIWGTKGSGMARTGFKFVNTGGSRVTGVDLSLVGQGEITKKIKVNLIAGYTFTKPVGLNPDLVYAVDSAPVIKNNLTYLSTSSDTTGLILKYRSQHIAKADISIDYKRFSIGYSIRSYSYVQNIDKIIYILDTVAILPTGIYEYRELRPKKANIVMDARLQYRVKDYLTIGLVTNNVANKIYTNRPLKIEKPRTFALQLGFRF